MADEELKNKLTLEAQNNWNKLNMYKRFCGSEFSYYDGYIDCGLIKEKQIQIDAEQIRALQRQNGELTDELTKKSNTNHQLVEQMAELNERNAELKCECRRCVYTDSPCVLSDFEKDRNGICDHFKDVFDELTITNNECKDMREELKQRIRENQKLCEQIEKMKSDVMRNVKWADQNKNEQMYCKLNAMFNQWEIKEK